MDANYWEKRYQENETGWDIGSISTPIKEYIDQLTDKELKILIPGAGNGYEFDYLIENEFTESYVIDIAKSPLENILNRNPNYSNHLIHNDFFKLENSFDLIIEQTFFCALNPDLRKDYVNKMHNLLKPKGKIIGLLFNFPLTEDGPPFGGSLEEYLNLFSKLFHIKTIEKCYNSIQPRAEKELFFIFEKK